MDIQQWNKMRLAIGKEIRAAQSVQQISLAVKLLADFIDASVVIFDENDYAKAAKTIRRKLHSTTANEYLSEHIEQGRFYFHCSCCETTPEKLLLSLADVSRALQNS